MKVGIFDSGIGGLTILEELSKAYPQNMYFYYADNLHMPYGERTYQEIKSYVSTSIGFFSEKKIDVLVVACNTASCVCAELFKYSYPFKIITIKPEITKASKRHKKLVLLATPNTLKSKTVKHDLMRVKKNDLVIFDTTNLAQITEEIAPNFYKNHAYIENLFSNVDYDSGVILGCTHYHYYKKYIENLGFKCYTPTESIIKKISKLNVNKNYIKKDCHKNYNSKIEIFLTSSFELSKYKSICDKLLN